MQHDHILEKLILYKPVTPVVGPFLAQGHNLSRFGRDPLGEATYQISRLRALWF